MPHCTATRARRRRDPLPANDFGDIASPALNGRTCMRRNSICVQRLSPRAASSASTRSINDVCSSARRCTFSELAGLGRFVGRLPRSATRSFPRRRQHQARQRAAEWKQGCIWALRPIEMDSATQDWHEEAPFDVCRIAHTGDLADIRCRSVCTTNRRANQHVPPESRRRRSERGQDGGNRYGAWPR